MIRLIRTNSEDQAFVNLVNLLDADLSLRDGEQHDFYDQFNKIADIKYVVVAFDGDLPVGCGAIKMHSENTMEVKRMYVVPEKRGQGIASRILADLEKWAAEMLCFKCILETGKKQPEAIALYKKNGYLITANFGQYVGVENSICFEKILM